MQFNAQSTAGGRYAAFSLRGSAGVPISRSALVCLALIASIYWLVCHRYACIYHDAIIYNLLSVRWLNPDAYVKDLFFTYGSQGDFSLYPPLFARLITWLGMDLANRVVVISGALLWLGALMLLARGMLVETVPIFVAVLINVATHYSYSLNGNTFELNENFATARSFALPLALMAIALDNTGRGRLATLPALLATALHPLLGIWSLLIALARRISDRQLAIAATALAFLFVVLAATGALPAFQVMDPAWVGRVRQTSTDVFVSGQNFALDRILFWIAACWAGGRFGSERYRRLYLLVALFAASAVLLSQICSHWLPVHLVMEVQPSRVLWLTVVFGLFALADSGWRIYLKADNNKLALLLLASVLYGFRDHSGVLLLAVIVLDWCGLLTRLGKYEILRHRYAPYFAAAVALLLLPNCLLSMQMDGLSVGISWLDHYPAVKGLIFGGAGLSFLLWAWLANRRWGAGLILLCGFPLLVYALTTWDARSPRLIETEAGFGAGENREHVFSAHVHPGSVVAWVGHATDIWFVIGTADYANINQAAGSVFSRPKTMEYIRRLRLITIAQNILADESEQRVWRQVLDKNGIDNTNQFAMPAASYVDATVAGIAYLCRDPLLEWLISAQKLEVAGKPQWRADGRFSGAVVYLYDCRQLRAEQGT